MLKLFIKSVVILQIIVFNSEVSAQTKDWWETTAFYQIYPRSFKDSNGDGIGDLNGITQKLSYLKGIGINATWLSPIFQSPMVDFGYDISDFYNIHSEYGNMTDFENLITEANKTGIKIILDFVPNHTSDECDWFLKSVNKTTGFEDFYIWHPGYLNATTNVTTPPSNWVSEFRGSAWKWHATRQEYYLHQFHYKQPDLNYRNSLVVNEMKAVLRFWLGKGVAGFRIDATKFLFETEKDSSGKYADEPLSGTTNDPDDPLYVTHVYTNDLPECVDMVYQWREVMDAYKTANGGDTRVIMTEAYTTTEILMQYYGNDVDRLGSNFPFNFLMITSLSNTSTAADYETVINTWLDKMSDGRTPNWVVGNHDNARVGTRFGEDRIDSMNMIVQTLPGVSVTYNGEELGMTNGYVSWNNTVDPQALATNSTIYQSYSRDPERTPFQWDNTTSGGFSTNATTWLPVASNYLTVNVATEEAALKSHLNIYKDLLTLRDVDTMKYGETTVKSINSTVLGIVRSLKGNDTYITIANLGRQAIEVNLSLLNVTLPNTITYYIVGVNSSQTVGYVFLRFFENFFYNNFLFAEIK